MPTTTSSSLYDVVAVDFKSSKVRIPSTSRDEANAEAVVAMAVMRRGVEVEFFGAVPAGMYKDGEEWHGNGQDEDDEEESAL